MCVTRILELQVEHLETELDGIRKDRKRGVFKDEEIAAVDESVEQRKESLKEATNEFHVVWKSKFDCVKWLPLVNRKSY